MRPVALSAVKAGMTRLLDKGGASAESLWLLRNGYVNASRRATRRPGTVLETDSLAGTKGLCAFRGGFTVFSHQVTPMTDPRFTCEVLTHPDQPSLPIKEIHFAEPFLGYLYVVAEFENGDVFHYWLERAEAWEPGKAYLPGALVMPTEQNGLAYRLVGGTHDYPTWAPDVAREVDDVVVPTKDNGYRYTVTSVIGEDAKSGTVEPDWPAEDGATVSEDANIDPSNGSGDPPVTPPALPPSIGDRYGSGGGRSGNSDVVTVTQ